MSDTDTGILERLNRWVDKMPKYVRYPVRLLEFLVIIGLFLILIAIVQNLYDLVGKIGANIFRSIF